MNNIINRVWNRGTMVNIEDLRGSLYQNEQLGHTFVISGVDGDGNVVSLSGTVDGAFLRPDNTTVAISGSASGGKAYVTLPANCYDVPGKCGLTIYLTADSQKTALYAAVVTVTRTSSDTASPGTTASVVDLVNAINAAISQIPATDTAIKAAMAPTYSNTGLYAVGSYAWYNGVLKRCIVPITTAESYTAAHWTDAALGNDLRDLKSAFGVQIPGVEGEFDNYFDIANQFDFFAKTSLQAIEGLQVEKISRNSIKATNGSENQNTGFWIPVTLNAGVYTISANFTADGTNNIRVFDSSRSELIRLVSGTPSTLTVENDNTLYYIRLYYQAYNSYITITSLSVVKSGEVTAIKPEMIPPDTKHKVDSSFSLYGGKCGLLANNSDYTAQRYLNNSGVIFDSQSYSMYSLSDMLPVDVGDKVYIPVTASSLNNQLGGYYKNNAWVANLGDQSEAIENGLYVFQLRDDIEYDSIRVNVYNAGTVTDFSIFLNGLLPFDRLGIRLAENVVLGIQERSGWAGKTWVALGDSWTEGAYTSVNGRYTDYVSEALGLTCINLGVGGTPVEKFAEQTDKPLTQEIASSADLITIWGSINNMAQGGVQCGTIDDEPSSSGTLMAKWKYTIEKVLSLNPMARLVIIGCPPSFHSSWTGYEPYNIYGDTIESSTEMIGKLARHYGLPFIDMYHLSGFNSENFGNSANNNFGYDKVHPSRKGVKRVSNVLIEQLLLLQSIY